MKKTCGYLFLNQRNEVETQLRLAEKPQFICIQYGTGKMKDSNAGKCITKKDIVEKNEPTESPTTSSPGEGNRS